MLPLRTIGRFLLPRTSPIDGTEKVDSQIDRVNHGAVMFGLFKKSTENRSGRVDIGELYSAFFGFGGTSYSWQVSPAVLASSLSVPDGLGSLLTESRRLAKICPLLISYRRCVVGALLTGEPESPTFPDTVPEATAKAAAACWLRIHDPDREREHLHRIIVDGECLILHDGTTVPADGYEPMLAGPEWMRRVTGYRVGMSSSARSDVKYLGDRREGDARAVPWHGGAMPFACALVNIRIAAGHGLGALAKVAAVIQNTSADRITAASAARSGLVGADERNANQAGREPLTSVGVGSVVLLQRGEEVRRIEAGPDVQAMNYEGQLERDAAAALNLPLSELVSDYSSGSFSNLRMAWQDAAREYTRRRTWWHRHYRLPMFREALSMAFADGALPGMSTDTLTQLNMPTWPGPKREPPQPEAEAKSLKMLVDAGILTAAQAATKLET